MTTLTPQQWAEIRQRYADGESAWDLSKELGVSARTIANRVTTRNPLRKPRLTEAQCREIRRRRAAGETLASLSDSFGVVTSQISKIARSEDA